MLFNVSVLSCNALFKLVIALFRFWAFCLTLLTVAISGACSTCVVNACFWASFKWSNVPRFVLAACLASANFWLPLSAWFVSFTLVNACWIVFGSIVGFVVCFNNSSAFVTALSYAVCLSVSASW